MVSHNQEAPKSASSSSIKLEEINCSSLTIVQQKGFAKTKSSRIISHQSLEIFAKEAQVIDAPIIREIYFASNYYNILSVAPTTSNTYHSVCNTISTEIETFINHNIKASQKGDWKVFPLINEEKIKLTFTALISEPSLRTKYLDSTTDDKRVKYSTIRSYRAALRHLHIINNVYSPLIYPSSFLTNWFEGVKRICSHNTSPKVPIELWQIIGFLKLASADLKAIKNDITFNTKLRPVINNKDNYYTPLRNTSPASFANVRRAVIIICGFFGVRRNSETLHLQVSDFQDCSTHYIIEVRFAKNDQFSKGHQTVVPHIPLLGELSPYGFIKSWLIIRAAFIRQLDYPKDHDFLFINIDGNEKSKGNIISYDTLSKDIKRVVAQVSSNNQTQNIKTVYSLRSGGSEIYSRADPAARHIPRFLGGWKTTADQLDATYAPPKAQDIAPQVITLATKAIKLWILKSEIKTIFNNTFFKLKKPIEDKSFLRIQEYLDSFNPSQVYQFSPLIFDNVEALVKKDARFQYLATWWKENKGS